MFLYSVSENGLDLALQPIPTYDELYSSIRMGIVCSAIHCAYIMFSSMYCTDPRAPAFLFTKNEKKCQKYIQNARSYIDVAIVFPIMEEVVFRGFYQPFLEIFLNLHFPNIRPYSYTFSVLLVSVGFGFAHLSSGLGGIHVLNTTLAGILLSILKLHYGLIACVVMHMTCNHISWAILILASGSKR